MDWVKNLDSWLCLLEMLGTMNCFSKNKGTSIWKTTFGVITLYRYCSWFYNIPELELFMIYMCVYIMILDICLHDIRISSKYICDHLAAYQPISRILYEWNLCCHVIFDDHWTSRGCPSLHNKGKTTVKKYSILTWLNKSCLLVLVYIIRFTTEAKRYLQWFISWQLTHLPKCRIYTSVYGVSIGSDNGLSPIRRQTIIWTNAGILLNEPLGKKLSERKCI